MTVDCEIAFGSQTVHCAGCFGRGSEEGVPESKMAKASKKQEEDLFFPEGAPPPYITTQQGINNSDTVISFPEVVVNSPAAGEHTLVPNFNFSDKLIRQGFIRKVYAIILAQLAVTGGMVAWFMADERVLRAVGGNMPVFLGVSLGTYLTTALCIMCCEGPRRRVPYNYIFLLLLTLAVSALVGVTCALYDARQVLLAAGVTFAIVLALTVFAFQTKIDFTLLSGSLLCLCLVVLLFGVAACAMPGSGLHTLYLALGVLLGCLFVVYDTQLIVGGDHRYAFSPEDYVFAALALYLDIVYIFVRLLRLMR